MNKIMICVDLNNESLDLFTKEIKMRDWNSVEEVHFIHGFQLQHYADAFYYTSYPHENQYDDIGKSVKEVLKPLENEVKELNKEVQIISKCIITSSPKESLVGYAKDNEIDSMVIGTRGKHGIAGFFSSSFAEYMVGHAPCELRIIRGS